MTPGAHEHSIDATREPARREREDQVDETDLHDPAGHATDAVEHIVARLRQSGQEPPEPGSHQQEAETLVRSPEVGVQAGRNGHGHHERPAHRDESRVVPRLAARPESRGACGDDDADGPGRGELQVRLVR